MITQDTDCETKEGGRRTSFNPSLPQTKEDDVHHPVKQQVFSPGVLNTSHEEKQT